VSVDVPILPSRRSRLGTVGGDRADFRMLFTGVRGREILGISPYHSSEKLGIIEGQLESRKAGVRTPGL
jgi:hypothetical protein